MIDETMRDLMVVGMDEYTEHANECLNLLADHNLITFNDKDEFQINNKFVHTILFISGRYLLNDPFDVSWSEVNENIMKELKIPPNNHDNFVFAVNSLLETILTKSPNILFLGNDLNEKEKESVTNTTKLIFDGYTKLSTSIFTNMSEYR